MQLSPLQSRLAASVMASCLLVLVYLALFSPRFAMALDLDLELDAAAAQPVLDSFEHLDVDPYEPEFPLLPRSIIGRAPAGVTALDNNAKVNKNVNPGDAIQFMVEMSSVSGRGAGREKFELRKRGGKEGVEEEEGEKEGEQEAADLEKRGADVIEENGHLVRRATTNMTLYISANTCIQPEGNATKAKDKRYTGPPQLNLYVSNSTKNTEPGPSADKSQQVVVAFDEGAVMYSLSLTKDSHFAIGAPNISTDAYKSTVYNFEVAASIDQWYHSFNDETLPNLVWVDSDANATLLTTNGLTSKAGETMDTTPYTMFVYRQDYMEIRGMQNSMCALSNNIDIPASKIVTGLTSRGATSRIKQEFYISGLNSSARYVGVLAKDSTGNGTASRIKARANEAGGGGEVFRPTAFETKSTSTCQIIYNLTFCDQNAYAVPSNSTRFPNATSLASFYDDYAASVFSHFDKVMQQIPCEIDITKQYSLVRTCQDCRDAYKNWLCSVSIPRCEDFSNPDVFLMPRNINAAFPNGSHVLDRNLTRAFADSLPYNSSRLQRIDDKVQPGPYKEVLPCDDLCYALVQSCPAAVGFSCARPGSYGFDTSYGRRQHQAADSNVTCNYPGSAHFINAAGRLRVGVEGAGLGWSLLLLVLVWGLWM